MPDPPVRKPRRAERIAALVKLLTDEPGAQSSLSQFAARFQAARSTISEDVAIIKEGLEAFDLGRVETQPGSSGGARYLPFRSAEHVRRTVASLCGHLASPDRVLPGGYLYTSDLIFSPVWAWTIGEVFATLFDRALGTPPGRGPGGTAGVVTVETKGIPIALMTARALGLPLVIIRRDARVTEGPAVSINYFSGSTGHIQSMSLPRRALAPGARVLFVDDFMRAGGTARGVQDLMAEFEAEVVGTGVLTATWLPERKLVDRYIALTVLEKLGDREVAVRPGPLISEMV